MSNYLIFMMTSSNGNIFLITGPLCREFTDHRWIPRTQTIDMELWCFLLINVWVNNCEAGDLRCHHAHYDTIVIFHQIKIVVAWQISCRWYIWFGLYISSTLKRQQAIVSFNDGPVPWCIECHQFQRNSHQTDVIFSELQKQDILIPLIKTWY